MSFSLNYKAFLLAGASAAALAGPAFALDGKDMMDKIVAAYGAYGAQVTYQSAETNGSDVTVTGVRLKFDDPKQPVSIPVGDITFNDVTENRSGGYSVGSMHFKDVDFTNEGVHVTATGLEVDEVTIPAKPDAASIDGMPVYKSAHSGPITIAKDGKQIAQVASVTSKVNVSDDKSKVDLDSEISGIAVDLTTVKDPEAKKNIEKLGMTSLDGNIVIKGAWTAQTGKVDISEYSMDFKDIGKLNFTFSLSGYTQAFWQAMRDASEAAKSNPDKKSADAAMGLAMMGLLQQLTFNSASLRFDDASITKRVLDLVGSQKGMTGEQLAQSVKGMIPIMMARLNMPALQQQVSTAVNAYLDDPKNIEIKADPLNPVAVPVIMGAAMGAPQTIPQVLGVTVSANQ